MIVRKRSLDEALGFPLSPEHSSEVWRPRKRLRKAAPNLRKRKARKDPEDRPTKYSCFDMNEDPRFIVSTRGKRRRQNPPIEWNGNEGVDDQGRIVFCPCSATALDVTLQDKEEESPTMAVAGDQQDIVIVDDLVYSSDEESLVGVNLVETEEDEAESGDQQDILDDLVYSSHEESLVGVNLVVTEEDEAESPTMAVAGDQEGGENEHLGSFFNNGVRRSCRLNPMEQLGSIRVDGNRRSARLRRATNS